MIINHVTIDYAVRCDLCGHTIEAGSTCRIRTDTIARKVYFEHIVCPSAVAVVVHRLPPPRRNENAMRLPSRSLVMFPTLSPAFN